MSVYGQSIINLTIRTKDQKHPNLIDKAAKFWISGLSGKVNTVVRFRN